MMKNDYDRLFKKDGTVLMTTSFLDKENNNGAN